MSKPWSKLKSRIEALWVPGMSLAIHANSYTHDSGHDKYQLPRHWLLLDKQIIWDFPGPFLHPKQPVRGQQIIHWYDITMVRSPDEKPVTHPPTGNTLTTLASTTSSMIAILLRQYLDRPRDKLFEPFPLDQWELIDMLRAADARVGRSKLAAWASTLDDQHPAQPVLRSRMGASG